MSQHHHDHGSDAGVSHADEHGHDHAHHSRGLRGWLTSVFKPHSHDAADSVDSALESSAEGIRALKISLVALGVTALLQLLLVFVSGSVALLADTIHNFSDALTAIPLWIAFAVGRRVPNRRYTYGYGRAEDLAGIFIVLMIALSAAVAGYEAFKRLLDPQPMEYAGVVLVAGLIGFAGNELVALYRIRVGRKIGSAALVADGHHARVDGFTSLAVVAAAIGVMAGFPLADPIVGLLITVAILVVLKGAATDIFQRIMDGVDPELVESAERALRAVPGVAGVDELRMRWIGHRIRAEASIAIAATVDVSDAYVVAELARHDLLHALPKLDDALIRVIPFDQVDDPFHDHHRHGATADHRGAPTPHRHSAST